jgi:CheY-like chemotaxis protein
MDIRMPKISGIELCKALRLKYAAHVRFVALTAHVFEQDKQTLREQGFDIVLSKPFHEEDLVKMFGVPATSTETVAISAAPYVVDLGPLRKLTMNDEQLLNSVLQQFLEETQSDLAMLGDALSEGELRSIREIVHKLAGRTGQMGILSLSLKLRQLENRIEEGETLEGLQMPLIHVRREVEELVKTIQSLVLEKSHS